MSNTHTPVPTLTQKSGTPPLYQPVPHTPGTAPDLHKHPTPPPVPNKPPGTALSEGKTAGQRLYQPVPSYGRGRGTPPTPHPLPPRKARHRKPDMQHLTPPTGTPFIIHWLVT